MPPNATELEFYQTAKLDKSDAWEYRIEIEHGLSPRWDISVYQIFSQNEGDAFKWDAVQFRTRYRLVEPGQMMFDPVLYLEYRRKIDLKKQNKAEVKLLLSEDFDRFNLAINPVYEFFWAPGDPIHELGLDVGASREVSFAVSLGLESTSRIEFLPDGETETGWYVGPTFSLAPGDVYFTFGYAWGITDDSNDARMRFLMGVDI
jgi:hypothetical protein